MKITPHAEAMPPELQQRLLTAIRDARPAGVQVMLEGARPPRKVDLELRLTTSQGLLAQDLRAAQREVREQIAKYWNKTFDQTFSVPGLDNSVQPWRIAKDGSVTNGLA